MYKTQVFVAPVCGQFRTRLTHTIEVTRVARALAASLHLNPDLAESVALAHDLGHPPFGHSGERVLASLMTSHGGFEHNAQAIRIVTELERSYMEFNGLNLTWETLEGIAKHNGPVVNDVPPAIAEYSVQHDLELHTFPSAEAQVAAVADDIAYNCHDLQDGLRAGFFNSDELSELPIVGLAFARMRSRYGNADPFRLAQTALRHVFGELTEDVVKESMERLQKCQPKSVQDIRNANCKLVGFSEECFEQMQVVRSFLAKRVYQNREVIMKCDEGSDAIEGLFKHYSGSPQDLPPERRQDFEAADNISNGLRSVADYICGLTDRFALDEYNRIFGMAMDAS